MFPFWEMVLKLSKRVHFLKFCADLSKKSKSIKAIYIYESKKSRYALSANGIVYYAMTYCFGDITVWNWSILLDFYWVSIFFDILIANISWTSAQTPINHIIFWKSVLRTFRCTDVTCFNRLRFLSEVTTKLQKMHFFGLLKDRNSRRNHGNYTNSPISSIFSTLTVCKIHFCIWKNSKFIFMWSQLWPILACKIP